MAKTLAISRLELCPGVTENDFEKYVIEELYPNIELPVGCRGYLLKREKGEDKDPYRWVYEFESVEARDKAEAEKWWETPTNQALFKKWEAFECRFFDTHTHFIEVK